MENSKMIITIVTIKMITMTVMLTVILAPLLWIMIIKNLFYWLQSFISLQISILKSFFSCLKKVSTGLTTSCLPRDGSQRIRSWTPPPVTNKGYYSFFDSFGRTPYDFSSVRCSNLGHLKLSYGISSQRSCDFYSLAHALSFGLCIRTVKWDT